MSNPNVQPLAQDFVVAAQVSDPERHSIDCLNWFPAGCVARWRSSVHRSFMYPSAVIDGVDLVVVSRTSRDSGNQHDADLCTVHRVRDFRNLAMDLHSGGLHV